MPTRKVSFDAMMLLERFEFWDDKVNGYSSILSEIWPEYSRELSDMNLIKTDEGLGHHVITKLGRKYLRASILERAVIDANNKAM